VLLGVCVVAYALRSGCQPRKSTQLAVSEASANRLPRPGRWLVYVTTNRRDKSQPHGALVTQVLEWTAVPRSPAGASTPGPSNGGGGARSWSCASPNSANGANGANGAASGLSAGVVFGIVVGVLLGVCVVAYALRSGCQPRKSTQLAVSEASANRVHGPAAATTFGPRVVRAVPITATRSMTCSAAGPLAEADVKPAAGEAEMASV